MQSSQKKKVNKQRDGKDIQTPQVSVEGVNLTYKAKRFLTSIYSNDQDEK